MNPHQSGNSFSSSRLRALLVSALLLSAFLLIGRDIGINRGQAQTSTQEQAQGSSQEIEEVPPGQEKTLEDKIPQHLPIKVKVKNLNSKRWVHDLEVEVTNTSEKPIYFLDFHIILPEVILIDDSVGFPLRYGRIELIKFTTPLEPGDVPIQPGEVHVFKISKSSAQGWDDLREKKINASRKECGSSSSCSTSEMEQVMPMLAGDS
jgi:hypothetical protein